MSLNGASDNISWLERLLVVSRLLASKKIVENQTFVSEGKF